MAEGPWGLAGANESWISLQSDSDWSEINFHLKFVPPAPGNPLLKASAGLAPFTIACFYRPRQMSSSNPTQKNVCFLGMYRTKRSLQLLRQCVGRSLRGLSNHAPGHLMAGHFRVTSQFCMGGSLMKNHNILFQANFKIFFSERSFVGKRKTSAQPQTTT